MIGLSAKHLEQAKAPGRFAVSPRSGSHLWASLCCFLAIMQRNRPKSHSSTQGVGQRPQESRRNRNQSWRNEQMTDKVRREASAKLGTRHQLRFLSLADFALSLQVLKDKSSETTQKSSVAIELISDANKRIRNFTLPVRGKLAAPASLWGLPVKLELPENIHKYPLDHLPARKKGNWQLQMQTCSEVRAQGTKAFQILLYSRSIR